MPDEPACDLATCDEGYCCEDPSRPYLGACDDAPPPPPPLLEDDNIVAASASERTQDFYID